ncbi:folC protein [Pediococcus claussenii]|nr:folC protein [Pediococcus claussenii]
MKMLLERLDNPQQNLHIVHVAGTNGKGSTVAFLRQMIIRSGHKVGSFTSPFITKFNERISVNGEMIPDKEVIKLVEAVKPVIEQMDMEQNSPLEFETITAMMFLYFAKNPVDVVIVEVGIGGLYDSTNVVKPLISVITNIGFDHMEMLGDTLSKIAFQKAGIIKKNAPVVSGVLEPEAFKVIEQIAKKKKVKLLQINRDFRLDHHSMEFSDIDIRVANIQLGLQGDFQFYNAAIAIETFEEVTKILKWNWNHSSILQALEETKWPGRLETVRDKPLIILDGAHNLPGIQALVRTAKRQYAGHKIHFLVSILKDKLFNQMISELETVPNSEIILTTFQQPNHRATVGIESLGQKLTQNITYNEDWKRALVEIIKGVREQDVIVVTGSLYFISEVRQNMKNF